MPILKPKIFLDVKIYLGQDVSDKNLPKFNFALKSVLSHILISFI